MRGSDWRTRPLEDELGEALRAELLSWPGVVIRPMMGALGFWRRKRMLGCYVNRDLSKRKPSWLNRPGEPALAYIRLGEADAERALRRPSVAPARLGANDWIGIPLVSRDELEQAVRWFGIAYEHPPARAAAKRKGSSKPRK